jgi:Autophagocytosis associated protein, active-site domain
MTEFENGCERIANAFRGLSCAALDDHEWTRANQSSSRIDVAHDGDTKNQSSSALLPITYPLIHWRAEKVDGFDSYLRHDPVALFIRRDLVLDDNDDDDDEQMELFVDETVLGDADAFQNEAKKAASPSSFVHDDDAIETAWIFSIVYSHTWLCPVLYFTITGPDGSALLSRDSVVRILSSFHDQNPGSGGTWEFVSIEEHPILGVPAFILHPCRTTERLNLLFQSCSDPLVNDEAGQILAWMSMILPSVGFGIPSRLYLHLRDVLTIAPSDDGRDGSVVTSTAVALSPTK